MKTKRGPGRPKLPKSQRRVTFKFRLHPKTGDKLKAIAKLSNVSMTKIVGQLIDSEPMGYKTYK